MFGATLVLTASTIAVAQGNPAISTISFDREMLPIINWSDSEEIKKLKTDLNEYGFIVDEIQIHEETDQIDFSCYDCAVNELLSLETVFFAGNDTTDPGGDPTNQ